MNLDTYARELACLPHTARRHTTLSVTDNTYFAIHCAYCPQTWFGTPSKCHPTAFDKIANHLRDRHSISE